MLMQLLGFAERRFEVRAAYKADKNATLQLSQILAEIAAMEMKAAPAPAPVVQAAPAPAPMELEPVETQTQIPSIQITPTFTFIPGPPQEEAPAKIDAPWLDQIEEARLAREQRDEQRLISTPTGRVDLFLKTMDLAIEVFPTTLTPEIKTKLHAFQREMSQFAEFDYLTSAPSGDNGEVTLFTIDDNKPCQLNSLQNIVSELIDIAETTNDAEKLIPYLQWMKTDDRVYVMEQVRFYMTKDIERDECFQECIAVFENTTLPSEAFFHPFVVLLTESEEV